MGLCTLIRFHCKIFDLSHVPVTVDAARVPEHMWTDCTESNVHQIYAFHGECVQLSFITHIAVFPILADVVKVKKGSGSTAHWSIDFIRLSGWLRRCFTLLITPLDIDGIGQIWEHSNIADSRLLFVSLCIVNDIVPMKLLVTKRKAMWSSKAMGAIIVVFTFNNAGAYSSYSISSMSGPP